MLFKEQSPLIGVLSLSLLLLGCERASTPVQLAIPPQVVSIQPLHLRPVDLVSELPGRVTAVRTAEVRPQVSGILKQRLFLEGAQVKAGQTMYQIDPAPYQAAYDKAVATRDSNLALLNRYKPLIEQRAVSRQQYDDALASYRAAQADVESAKINLAYTRISAPITGRAGRSTITEGALVTNGQNNALTTITQLDPIYVDLVESSKSLLSLRRALRSGALQGPDQNSAKVKLQLEDGSEYPHPGTLEFTEVVVSKETGSLTVRAAFANPDGELLPGMFVHAQVQSAVKQDGLLVPAQAVLRDQKGEPYVFRIGADNTAEQRYIATSRLRDGVWLVESGLEDGDRVVTQGLQGLQPGAAVTVNTQEPALPPIAENASFLDSHAR